MNDSKRIFDIFLCIVAGLLLMVPAFMVASVILVTTKGPVIFWSNRVGRNNKIFSMAKFRTMRFDTPTVATNDLRNPKLHLTSVGAFLRKTSLDELPQLWNVLKGDMSLVGPRPCLPTQEELISERASRGVFSLRPGITGPASLKYANEEELLSQQLNPEKFNKEVIFPDKVSINLDYYREQNLILDLKIIFATIFRTNY